jgi:hypothetical protein
MNATKLCSRTTSMPSDKQRHASYIVTCWRQRISTFMLKIETVKGLMFCYITICSLATRRNIPEDTILHSHRRENLKSYIVRQKSVDASCCAYSSTAQAVLSWQTTVNIYHSVFFFSLRAAFNCLKHFNLKT